MSSENNVYSQAAEQKELVHAVRADFFKSLLQEWSRPPEEVDELMGQTDCFYLPDFARSDLISQSSSHSKIIMINDVERGLLACSVTPTDENGNPSEMRWVYSIMQAGDWLRYGVLIQGPPRRIFNYTQHQEYVLSVEKIWDRPCDNQVRDAAGLLLEWRFNEPEFYKEFAVRERFIIIARHLHFRLGRIIQTVVQQEEIGVDDQRDSAFSDDDFRHENFGE